MENKLKELENKVKELEAKNSRALKDHLNTIEFWDKTKEENKKLYKEVLYLEEKMTLEWVYNKNLKDKILLHCIFLSMILFWALMLII